MAIIYSGTIEKRRRRRNGVYFRYTTFQTAGIAKEIYYDRASRNSVQIWSTRCTHCGIYRPPRPIGNNYHVTLEKDLNDLILWAAVQKSLLVITGDLNLDRLRPLSREGKILCDLEDTHGLTCVITRPTRITNNSQTLIDVNFTNKPELFKDCGVCEVGISDHALVYGLMKERNGFYEARS